MSGLTYAFDPSKGETPQSVARRRALAEQLASSIGSPTDIGSGLTALGKGIGSRIASNKADKAERAGMAAGEAAMNPIIAALTGGSSQTSDAAYQMATAPAGAAGPGADYIRSGLVERGMPGHVADAFVVNMKDESGLNPGINEEDPTVPGSRGGYGLYQLTGPRRRDFEAYAKSRGVAFDDVDAQLDFLMREGQTTERSAFAKILAAPDTATAAKTIVTDFLRPAEKHRNARVARYARLPNSQPDPDADRRAEALAYNQQHHRQSPDLGGPQTAAQAVNDMGQGGQQPQQPDPWSGTRQAQAAPQSPPPQQRALGGYMPVNSERSDNPDPALIRQLQAQRQQGQQGNGGGLRASIAKLFGLDNDQPQGGQPQQQPPQPMPPQMPQQPQPQPMTAPVEPVQRQPMPMNPNAAQGQPPGIGPGNNPRMAPQSGQPPMAQGREGLVSALTQQNQPAPPPPQARGGAEMPQQPQIPVQAQQMAAQRQQQTGAQIPLAQLLQAAQNPWVAQNPLYSGIINKLVSNQLDQNKPMTPQEVAEYEGALLSNQKARLELGRVGKTGNIDEYEYGQQNPGFNEQQIALKEAGSTKLVNENNMGQNTDKFAGKSDEMAAARLNTVMEAGAAAPEFIGQIQQLADLSKMIGTGKGAQFVNALGPYAEAMGFSVEGLDEMQAFEGFVSRLVPLMRPPGSGVQSDMDTRMFLQSLPALGKTPGGNEIIAQTFEAVAQTRIKAAEIASLAYIPKEAGGLTWQEAEKQIRQLPNPYELFKQQRKTMGGATKGGRPGSTNIGGYQIEEIR